MKRLLLTMLLIIPVVCFCQVPDPMPNTYVNDLSGVLSAEQVHTLNEKILAIENKSSVQIAVIVLNKLPDNMAIEDYALEVGKKWHVGNAKNGLVYVAAIDQHKQRLEVAGNLEGDIPDIEALHITDNIKPFFRNKDYYGGIDELLNGINQRIDPVIKQQMALAAAEQEKKNENTKQGFITFFLWLLSLGVAFIFVRFVILRNYFKAKKEKREQEEEKERQERYSIPINPLLAAGAGYAAGSYSRPSNDNYVAPPSYDSGRSSSGSSSSGSDSSSYGNWGSGSSDSGSSSSDSGFSGGGSSNDW